VRITVRTHLEFDQFDYRIMGVKSRWTLDETVDLLTCFEMDICGYFPRDRFDLICPKIQRIYWNYLIDMMSVGKLAFITPEDLVNVPPSDVSGDVHFIGDTSFDKNEFFECVNADNRVNLDIAKLKRYLSGEDEPNVSDTENTADEIRTEQEDRANNDAPRAKNERMQQLAHLSHKSREDAKDDIRKFIRNEMKPPCTCYSSQMKRHILKLAKKPDSGISLTYKTKSGTKNITEPVLRRLVNHTMGKERIQDRNMALQCCPKHGQN